MQTPLHIAAKNGSKAIADALITKYEVEKECYDYKHRTPLFIAAEYSKRLILHRLFYS